MALVPAKCTQCGASIEVDPSQEAGICKSCGTAFITEKVIKNYNTFNVDNSVNIYLGGKGDNKKEERNDEIRGLIVSLDYTDVVDTYERIEKILGKYPGSAEAHSSCALAIAELMTRNITKDTCFGEMPDYEMYLGEVKGKDVYIKMSYPIGLIDKAKKLAKNETEKQAVLQAEQEFYQKITCKLHMLYLGPSKADESKSLETAESIVKTANKRMDETPRKKMKFNLFFWFLNPWEGHCFEFVNLLGDISIILIPFFIIAMCIPVAREWLLARWFLFGVISLVCLFGLYMFFSSLKDEISHLMLHNSKEERAEGVKYAKDYNSIIKNIEFREDNYWYALVLGVVGSANVYQVLRRLDEDIKKKKIKATDVDWIFVYEQVYCVMKNKGLNYVDDKALDIVENNIKKYNLEKKIAKKK